jgi:hypothetical protein
MKDAATTGASSPNPLSSHATAPQADLSSITATSTGLPHNQQIPTFQVGQAIFPGKNVGFLFQKAGQKGRAGKAAARRLTWWRFALNSAEAKLRSK